MGRCPRKGRKKMRKKEVLREMQRVMAGVSPHTCILVRKLAKGWEYETSFPATALVAAAKNEAVFRHCSDEITLSECDRELTV